MLKEGAGGFLLMVENLHKDNVIQYEWFLSSEKNQFEKLFVNDIWLQFPSQKASRLLLFSLFWTLDNFNKIKPQIGQLWI